MSRGGARPGAGRKKKDRSGQDRFESAQAYLEAVVKGETPADNLRISAAKTLIKYEAPKQRSVKPSPSPKALARKETFSAEAAFMAAFEKVAVKIRKKHERSKAK